MAEIKVAIKGDDADFKRKMAESGAEARHFSEVVKESLAQTKEGVADLMGEQGFGQIVKLFSAGGLAVGVAGFGGAIVDAFKEGISSAIDFEDKVSKMRLTLGTASAGMADDIAKWIEAQSGAMGSIEENIAAFDELKRSGMSVEEAKNALINIQNAARETGGSIEAITHAFAEMKVAGEIPARFFKENLGIEARVKNMLGPTAAPDAAWMLRSLLPSYGGLEAQTRKEAQATEAGQLKDLGVQYKMMEEEIGHELLPSMKDFTNWLKTEIPVISEDLKAFASALEGVINFFHGFAPAFIRAEPYPSGFMGAAIPAKPQVNYPGIWDFLGAGFKEAMTPISQTNQKLDAAAEKLNRALDPK
jgi:hypothetical protein